MTHPLATDLSGEQIMRLARKGQPPDRAYKIIRRGKTRPTTAYEISKLRKHDPDSLPIRVVLVEYLPALGKTWTHPDPEEFITHDGAIQHIRSLKQA